VVTTDKEMAPEQAARYHEGLAHPARVCALRVLRERGASSLADLREAIAGQGVDLDRTTLKFHVRKLVEAGLVDLDGEDVALLVDVALRVRHPKA
jgi:DNA-binding transcriptional ArsR family regulator